MPMSFVLSYYVYSSTALCCLHRWSRNSDTYTSLASDFLEKCLHFRVRARQHAFPPNVSHPCLSLTSLQLFHIIFSSEISFLCISVVLSSHWPYLNSPSSLPDEFSLLLLFLSFPFAVHPAVVCNHCFIQVFRCYCRTLRFTSLPRVFHNCLLLPPPTPFTLCPN